MQDGTYFFKIRGFSGDDSTNCKSLFEDEILEIFKRQVPFGLKYVWMGKVFDGPVKNLCNVIPQMISVLRKRGMEKLFDMNTSAVYS